MYSDFLEASPGNSSKLQALQTVLQQNINDGCALLKQQSSISSEVNFTTEQGSGNQENVCTSEDLANLRVHCLDQSLLQNFIATPYYNVFREIQTDCLNNEGSCGWISRRFEEPERSIVADQAVLNCASS